MSLTRVDYFLVERKFVLFCFLIFAKNIHLYSKMCELCELCELLERHCLAMGFTYFYSAEFIRHFRGPQRALLEWGEEE